MAISLIRFNCVDPVQSGGANADRYRAMVEMAAFADSVGFDLISLEEHHSTHNGWSPSPLMNAGLIVGATERLQILVTALLVPLHDPIRVAEDLAVLDCASRGRVGIVTGLGYRPIEYHLLGKEWQRRGKLLDRALDVMLQAWTGEPFEYEGEVVQVTPVPYSDPHPQVWIGGASPAAARRAGRLGLPFYPDKHDAEIEEIYEATCAEHGHQPLCMMPPPEVSLVHVADDPERWWDLVGEHFLYEATTYSSWQPDGHISSARSLATTVDELKAEGRYRVLTPEECIEKAKGDPMASFAHHPLVGGTPPELGWQSLQLFADRVLPHI